MAAQRLTTPTFAQKMSESLSIDFTRFGTSHTYHQIISADGNWTLQEQIDMYNDLRWHHAKGLDNAFQKVWFCNITPEWERAQDAYATGHESIRHNR